MSTSSRLILGSVASWGRIFTTVASQIVLVPIYLTHWNTDTYGVWLAIQAISILVAILDFGHQNFLGYEFLKLGRDNKKQISTYLSSGAAFGVIICIFQIVVILPFFATTKAFTLLGVSAVNDAQLIHDARIVLLLQALTWLLCTSVSGLISRSLEVFGYFPRMSLWQLIMATITAVTPAIAVTFGAGLLKTGIITAAVAVICIVPQYLDMLRLLKKEKIPFISPSLKLGLKNFTRSLPLCGRTILENTRQQGVRLIIAPLSGISALASFTTMRTLSNFALQGLNTITYPLMPELSRFLHQRDQDKIESAFATLWIVLIIVLSPAVVILQAFVEPLFSIWTRGKLLFNPSLFAALSVSVLVYALGQPAVAIIVGNNLVKVQLFLSIFVAIIVIAGIVIFLPFIGIVGAGLALLVAEIFATISYKYYAEKWLKENNLKWPNKSFLISANSICIAAISMSVMILFPVLKWFTLTASMGLLSWNFIRFWKGLPKIATDNVTRVLQRFKK